MSSSSDDVVAGCGKKTSWPEVVGLSIKEAKKIILKDKPDADIIVLPVGTAVTEDFRPNRVRIFVGTVAETPHELTKMSSMETSGEKKPAGGTDGHKEKTSWPELVGKPVEEARKVILKDKPEAQVVVVPVGSPVTMDYRTDRVRIFVDTVAQVPRIG